MPTRFPVRRLLAHPGLAVHPGSPLSQNAEWLANRSASEAPSAADSATSCTSFSYGRDGVMAEDHSTVQRGAKRQGQYVDVRRFVTEPQQTEDEREAERLANRQRERNTWARSQPATEQG